MVYSTINGVILSICIGRLVPLSHVDNLFLAAHGRGWLPRPYCWTSQESQYDPSCRISPQTPTITFLLHKCHSALCILHSMLDRVCNVNKQKCNMLWLIIWRDVMWRDVTWRNVCRHVTHDTWHDITRRDMTWHYLYQNSYISKHISFHIGSLNAYEKPQHISNHWYVVTFIERW